MKITDKKFQSAILSRDVIEAELNKTNDEDILILDGLERFSKIAKIHNHDTITIGSETGYGKTALAINIANSCLKTYNVIYVNLSNNDIDMQERLIAQATNCDIDDITDDIVDRYCDDILKDCNQLMFFNDANLDNVINFIKDVCSISKQTVIVIIDNINNIYTNSHNYEKLEEVSKELRKLSRNTNIILFNLAQLSRASIKAENSIIDCNVHSFADARIENHSTHVIFFGEKNFKDYLILKKNRYGVKGVETQTEVDYCRKTQNIKECPPRRIEPLPPRIRRY